MDRGAWWATAHGVAKSGTRLSNWAAAAVECSLIQFLGCPLLMSNCLNLPFGLRKGPRGWSLACKKQGTNRLLCPGAHRVLLSFHTKQWGQCKTGRSFTGGLCEFRSVEQFGEIIWIFSEFHCIPQPHYSIPWIYLRKCFHIYSRNITVLFSNVSWP